MNSLTLTSRLDEINNALEFVTNYCNRHALEKKRETILALLLEELIANTVNHGQAPAKSAIVIDFEEVDGETVIVYRDHGRAFDPTEARASTKVVPDLSRAGGYGWPLIRHYCRTIEYHRSADQNRCTLTVRHF